MTSKIISSTKSNAIPIQKKDVSVIVKRELRFKKSGGIDQRRDLTQLSPPYDLRILRTIGESSTILNQCIDAYAQNIVGFGMGSRYKVDEKEATDQMAAELESLDALIQDLNLERPAKEVISEAIRHVEECGNGFIEAVRNGVNEVVGIDNLEPEYVTVTKINRVTMPDGSIRKFRYFIFRDDTDDSGRKQNGIWFKSFGDPTPLNIDGSIAKDGGGTATELLHLKIGDYNKPYGVPRYIGALIGILGDRQANELNYRYFTEGRHTPLAIILENAQLTAESEATLTNYANSIGGASSQHKFILLEAEKVSSDQSMIQDNEKDKAAIRLEKLADILQQDALFLEYSEKVTNDVLSAFRLPPVYVGLSTDYNRATVETAKELTEEQVFQPRREGYEWRLNDLFKEYDFKFVEIYLKSPDFSNSEDIKNLLTPAIQAHAVAPNDLRDLLAKVLNKPLESFEGEEYNKPIITNKSGGVVGIEGIGIDLAKAYGSTDESELAGMVRRMIRKGVSDGYYKRNADQSQTG